jgi:nitric oxide reductase NorQ protein
MTHYDTLADAMRRSEKGASLLLSTSENAMMDMEGLRTPSTVILATALATGFIPEAREFLAPFRTSATTAKGRSTGTTKERKPMTVASVTLGDGETSFTRPNGDLYYSRSWGEHMDVAVLRKAREIGQFVLLYGAPGCGKTALVEAAFGEDLHTVLGSGDTEVADLVGSYVDTGSGFRWEDGPLLKAAMEGKPLLIDEVGLIDPKVMSIVYGLMDGRREYNVTANPERGVVKAQDGFYVLGATNPNAPGVRLSEALLSRFTIQVEMTTDWTLAKKLGVPAMIATAAQNLARKVETGESTWAPQMRELLAFRDLEKSFGTRFAVENMMASAPEMDRPLVSEVLQRVLGEAVLPAKI